MYIVQGCLSESLRGRRRTKDFGDTSGSGDLDCQMGNRTGNEDAFYLLFDSHLSPWAFSSLPIQWSRGIPMDLKTLRAPNFLSPRP